MGLGAVLVVIALQQTDPVTVAIITAMMPVVGIGAGMRARRAAPDGARWSLGPGAVASRAGWWRSISASGHARSGHRVRWRPSARCFAFTWGSRATVTAFPDLTPLGRTAITVAGAGIGMPVVAVALRWRSAGRRSDWAGHRLARGRRRLSRPRIGSMALSQTLWIISVGLLGIGIASLHMNAVPFYVMLIIFALGGSLELGAGRRGGDCRAGRGRWRKGIVRLRRI